MKRIPRALSVASGVFVIKGEFGRHGGAEVKSLAVGQLAPQLRAAAT
jgi:hypothetical protein